MAMVFVWPRLPAVNQDECMPFFAATYFTKEPQAQSALLNNYKAPVFGWRIPLRCYPYAGPVRGFLYQSLSFPFGRPHYPYHRVMNTLFLGLLLGVLTWSAFRLGGGSAWAAAACLSLLLVDLSLQIQLITDEGQDLLAFLLGGCLWLLCDALLKSPRPRHALLLLLIVFLGVWDKINFLWLVGAALAGCLTAGFSLPKARRLPVAALLLGGMSVGLLAIFALIPDYARAVWLGMQKSGGYGLHTLLWKSQTLIEYLDPLYAHHRYGRLFRMSDTWYYDAYDASFMLFYGITAIGCLWAGWKKMRSNETELARPLLFAGAFLPALFVAVIKTRDSWAAHHILFLKPFAYVAFGLLIATIAAKYRPVKIGLCAIPVLWFGAVSVKGTLDLQKAPHSTGFYDVSWNAVDAWRKACDSPAQAVFALDWGAFYSGVMYSRPDQRWEMAKLTQAQDLRTLASQSNSTEIGLLLKPNGPGAWLLLPHALGKEFVSVSEETFDRRPGDPWIYRQIHWNRWPPNAFLKLGEESQNLLKDPDFTGWRTEKWEKTPDCASLTDGSCLRHTDEADSRLIQEIVLKPNVIYKISGLVRTEGVGWKAKGAHLGFVEYNDFAESRDLRGNSDWQELSFWVIQRGKDPLTVTFACRLGTFGSPNTGTAWFKDPQVRRVQSLEPDVSVLELTP